MVMDKQKTVLKLISFDKINKDLNWKYQYKSIDLHKIKSAYYIRIILKQSSHKELKHNGNIAHFDNLILSFDCQKKPLTPKKDHRKKNRSLKYNSNKKSILN